ncbi:MAG: hypothetical protein DHS20C11_19130 [Lysobacteraceae bacterium]|nr:MAG: hypothetical protein DHS20C11_19130 [Xanthomonadaceae bacterium]
MIGVILVLGAGALSLALRDAENTQLARTVSEKSNDLNSRVLTEVRTLLNAFSRMGTRWQAQRRTPQELWQSDAESYVNLDEVAAVSWLATSGTVERLVGNVDHMQRGSSLSMTDEQSNALRGLVESGGFEFSPIIDLPDGSVGIDLYQPVFVGRQHDGFLILTLRVHSLLDRITSTDRAQGFGVAAVANHRVVFSTADFPGGDEGKGEDAPFGSFELNLDADDNGWLFQVWLTPEATAMARSGLPTVVLLTGIIIAALVCTALGFLRSAVTRQMELVQLNSQLGVEVAERRKVQAELQRLAVHDGLTRLPNRRSFEQHLEKQVEIAVQKRTGLSLLFLDLDRFKDINDSLGHTMGDQLLRMVPERLRPALSDGDFVARFGGDEFVIVTPTTDVHQLESLAEALLKNMTQRFDLGDHKLFLSQSIGIAVFPSAGKTASELVSHADIALYRAKESGRNTFQFYDEDLHAQATERLETSHALRAALMRDEFRIVYQPRVALETGKIAGAEALLRWQRPGRGLVSAKDFIAVAEDDGFIINLGWWILERAVNEFAEIQTMFDSPLKLSVNISGRQLREPTFATRVAEIIHRSGIDPSRLELELTEHVLIENVEANRDTLLQLKKLGLALMIDDFGIGYSSLSYLKNFPVSGLKIDRSFVTDIAVDPDDKDIIRTVIAMGRSLRLTVVAEGVETAEQYAFLKQSGCHEAQGFLLSKGIPAEAWADLDEILFEPGRGSSTGSASQSVLEAGSSRIVGQAPRR